MNLRVIVKGCDDSTDFELVCTEEQYAFLKELAGTTQRYPLFLACLLSNYRLAQEKRKMFQLTQITLNGLKR